MLRVCNDPIFRLNYLSKVYPGIFDQQGGIASECWNHIDRWMRQQYPDRDPKDFFWKLISLESRELRKINALLNAMTEHFFNVIQHYEDDTKVVYEGHANIFYEYVDEDLLFDDFGYFGYIFEHIPDNETYFQFGGPYDIPDRMQRRMNARELPKIGNFVALQFLFMFQQDIRPCSFDRSKVVELQSLIKHVWFW